MSTVGEQVRCYVAGGIDYSINDDIRDLMVKHFAPTGRTDLAVALIHGWAVHRDEPATGYVRPALWGRAAVGVRAA